MFFMAFYDKYGTIKLKNRILKFYAQKRYFGTACRPLGFFSAKLKNFYGRCMFSKFPKNPYMAFFD